MQSLLSLADGLSFFNIDKAEFLGKLGIDNSINIEPQQDIPMEAALDAWCLAAKMTADPYIAIKLGLHAHPSDYNIIGQIMMQSNTVGEAFKSVGKNKQYISNSIITSKKISGGECSFHLDLIDEFSLHPGYQYPIERLIASCLSLMRYLIHQYPRESVVFNQVRLKHSRIGSKKIYESLFGCEVIFNCQYNEMRFDKALLSRPIFAADASLLKVLFAELKRKMYLKKNKISMTEKVQFFLFKSVSNGIANAARTAEYLNISQTTLKRKLMAEKTKFSDIQNSVKAEYALKLLKQENFKIADISIKLGYSEVSSFYVAFKRWYGVTPTQYRNQAIDFCDDTSRSE
jgi:AraC-like DNA-binding protein